jgi:3-dehydroquinate synthase
MRTAEIMADNSKKFKHGTSRMKTYHITGAGGDSRIIVGDSLEQLHDNLSGKKVVVITDNRVRQLYGDRFPSAPVISIGIGEEHKVIDTVRDIYSGLLEREADRSSFILGIGGGIVCDVSGFAASTYMRGIRFGLVASTLLAQVDAAIGGKNGVNFNGYKNLVGTFNQPEFVICDPRWLATLPERELRCGLAEIIKHGLIGDPNLFNFIETHVENILKLDLDIYKTLVSDAVAVKVAVVNRDEKEAGERRILNFGHTFGHAIERTLQISHGEAVSIGMMIALDLSAKKGYLSADTVEKVGRLLQQLKLPIRCDVDPLAVIDAVRKDKKRESDAIHFVLLRGIGEAMVERVSLAELEAAAREMLRP